MDLQQSKIINAIRFPLITLVVFIHMLPFEHQALEYDISIRALYIVLSEAVSHNVGRIAVPLFFVFSGYLFICNSEKKIGRTFFENKLNKRFRTLVIPYVLWNFFLIAAILMRNATLGRYFGLYDHGLDNRSFYELFWVAPADFPLWYVRDLICMTIFTPVFFIILKISKGWGLLPVGICYFFNIESGLPGFSTTAFFFYICGLLLGMRQANFLKFCLIYKKLLLVLSFFLLIVCLWINAAPEHEYCVRLFCPIAMASVVGIVGSCKSSHINKLVSLNGSCFFIYAMHEFYILGLMNGVYFRLFGTSDIAWLTRYITEPFLVIFICMVLYKCGKVICPKILSILTGGRF